MTPYLRFVSKDGDKVLLNGAEFKLMGKQIAVEIAEGDNGSSPHTRTRGTARFLPSSPLPALARRQNFSYPIWKWTAAVGLAGVLLYFALRGVERKRVGAIVAHASIAYSVGAC